MGATQGGTGTERPGPAAAWFFTACAFRERLADI
jgi:hypothetical protein